MNVKSGRRACCSRAHSTRSGAKWRFWPSKKRHKAPFSATFSSIFPVFFQRTYSEWHFGRKCDLEMALAVVDRQVCASEFGAVSDLTSSSSMASRAATTHVSGWLGRDEGPPASSVTMNVNPWFKRDEGPPASGVTMDVSPWFKRDEGPPASGVSPISTEALPKNCNRLQWAAKER